MNLDSNKINIDKRIIYLIISFFVFFIAFFIYQRIMLIKNYNENVKNLSNCNMLLRAFQNENNYILDDNFELRNMDINRVNQSPFYFLFLFNENDCVNCIRQETESLNHLKVTDNIDVFSYFISEESANDVAKRFNLLFDYKKVTDFQSVFINSKVYRTPCILVYSNESKFTDIYESQPNRFEKRDAFYKKWRIIINSFKENISQ